MRFPVRLQRGNEETLIGKLPGIYHNWFIKIGIDWLNSF